MNTKNLGREDRKAAKRDRRKKNQALYNSLSSKDKSRFRKSEEHKGLKSFVASLAKAD